MVSAADSTIEAQGLKVVLQRDTVVASLRYFDAQGPLRAALQSLVGGPLPAPLKAVRYPDATSQAEFVLAWRTPTETLILPPDANALKAISERTRDYPDAGCLVDQSGGFRLWRASGDRTTDLLRRMGSVASVPALGEARTSRVAELPVLALCVREGEILLLVERVYSDHLKGWMRETAADL